MIKPPDDVVAMQESSMDITPKPLRVTIEVRSNYGRAQAYPADDAAESFARIARTKTLTRQALIEIEKLGFAIVTTSPAIDWRGVE